MAKRRSKLVVFETIPASHLARMDALGLTAVSYRRISREVQGGGSEWLPRDLIGTDGKTLIIFREADRDYSIDGYEPWYDGMFGGRRAEIHNALAWVERARDVRSGKAEDFRGA